MPQHKNPNEIIYSSVEDTPDGTRIKLMLGNHIAEYGGFIAKESPKRIGSYVLSVDSAYRGQGIGEKMVRTLALQAKELGVETFGGHVESQYALDIRARVFGESALKFYLDENLGDAEQFPEQFDELPIDYEQARQSLVRAEQHEEDLEHRQHGFSVDVDISNMH